MRLGFEVHEDAVTLGALLESYERQRLDTGVLPWVFEQADREDKISALPTEKHRRSGSAFDVASSEDATSVPVTISPPKARRGSRTADAEDRFDTYLAEEEVAAVSATLAPFRTEPERLRLVEALG